jgi:hypothetical protein
MKPDIKSFHVARIKRAVNGKEYSSVLLRRSYRDNGKVLHETLASLTKLPQEFIQAIELMVSGENLVPASKHFHVEQSFPHGHVRAVLGAIRKLSLDAMIAPKRSRERDLVVAMIAARLIHAGSKLDLSGTINNSTLGAELNLCDVDVNEFYSAMDWLLDRQNAVEQKLAARHLNEGDLALYDVSNTYYEGEHCPLAAFGPSKEGKKGVPIIVFGVLGNAQGVPISIQVYQGNTGDPTTVSDQIEKLRGRFHIDHVALAGDRGMLTQTQINKLQKYPGIGWVSALRGPSIRKLIENGYIRMSLFDEQNLAEISSPDFPGERLIVCMNPLLRAERERTRNELIAATKKELDKKVAAIAKKRKPPMTAKDIGLSVGRVINKYKVAKHFSLDIKDGSFSYSARQDRIDLEASLDGFYVIRTSEPADRLDAPNVVRAYKNLCRLERLFRAMKSLMVMVRPIYHRLEPRVRAHIFICLLAAYVEHYMVEALAPLLFVDEELDFNRPVRDPVAPAETSPSAKEKKASRITNDGLPVQSFRALMDHLQTCARQRCKIEIGGNVTYFDNESELTNLQRKAFELLGV